MEEEEERTQENKKEKGKCKREREKQRRMHEAMSRKRENAGLPSAISHAKERTQEYRNARERERTQDCLVQYRENARGIGRREERK